MSTDHHSPLCPLTHGLVHPLTHTHTQMGGVTVFSIGVWTLSDKSFMERLLGSNLYVASAAILIATGVVVSIISFLGTLGAYREIRCMLITFFVILFMIFIVMLVGGILGYIFRSEVSCNSYIFNPFIRHLSWSL